MKPYFNLRIAGAAALFAGGYFTHALLFNDTSQSKPEPRLVPSKLEQEVKSLNRELASLQSENATLQSQLEERASFEIVEPAPQAARQGPGIARAMPFSDEQFKKMISQQISHQLDIYSVRLNLSPDQRAQMEDLMVARFMQMHDRRGHGPNEPGQYEQSFITQRDIDDLAAEMLSPEQLDEYNEMRQQETAARSEMMATAQMSQIAPQLGLSEEQKNQVYGIFYDQSIDVASGFSNPQQFQESRSAANDQIMEILDDKQQEVFKRIQQNQGMSGDVMIYNAGSNATAIEIYE